MILVYIALGVAQYYILKRFGKRYGAIIPLVSVMIAVIMPIIVFMFSGPTSTIQDWPITNGPVTDVDVGSMSPGLGFRDMSSVLLFALIGRFFAPIIYVTMIIVVKGPEPVYHQPFQGSFHNTSDPKSDDESVDTMNVHDL